VIDVLKDGKDTKYFIRGGFAEVNSEKITVLAEEAIPMAELAVEIIDQRIRDAEEDLAAAKTDAERHKAAETLDDLRLVRAAF
jgi:F-type H+-transporting ATPase subunit epsilon